jgi:transcriptional regulator with XRE-family HTH domain
MTNNQRIGARIRAARQDMGYTQDVLAAELDINTMAISKKERGIDATSVEQLHKLSRLLKRPIGWFVEGMK